MANTSTDNGKTKITSFPSDSLDSSLALVNKITQTRGEQPSTIKQIALATGIGEGTLPLPISTACQYGILENVHGSGYRPTELYTKISTPTFDTDKTSGRFEALSSPPLYKKILDTFNGKLLPNEAGFTNYITTTFQFKAYAIPRIVRAFFQNFTPFIDANSKLRFILPVKKDGMETLIEDVEPIIEQKQIVVVKERKNNFSQPIPLPGEKMIILEYPKGNMTADDFTALKAFISFLELSEGLTKEKRE